MSVPFRKLGSRKTAESHVSRRIGLRILLCLLAAGVATLTACSGGTSIAPVTPMAADQITVSVSPATATLAPGGAMQFAAVVSGTTQTSVSWTSSAGSISATGLFTAPSANTTTAVTVTASSLADKSKTASANVNVNATGSSGGLTIVSPSLAPAIIGKTYAAPLQAIGGQPPYQWNIVSGALPPGILLNSVDSLLGGTPTAVGDSAFVLELIDSLGKSVQQDMTLAVSAAVVCGPPAYLCSRTDTEVIAPAVPPQLGSDTNYYGGHSGAGMVGIDPAYGNRILRVTDGNTTTPGMSFIGPSDAESSATSFDESLFSVTNEGNAPCLFQFDQAAFTAHFEGCYYNVGEGNLQFGYTAANNRAFFNYYGPNLYRFVIDTSTWAISPDPAFNGGVGYFQPDGPECLDGQLKALGQWYVHDTALSSDDSTFIASLGIEQDKDAFIVVWNASKGCRWMNVKTWQVSQGWNTGLANPATIQWASGAAPTSPGGVHNVNLDRSGTYGVLTINGTSLPNKVFWTIDTAAVDDTCLKCVSHWACDYGVCFWDYQNQTTYDMRSQTIGQSDAVPDMDTTPALGNWDDDEHVSHANAAPGAKNMYLVAWQPNTGGSEVAGVWSDEIVGVSWDGSERTVRFNKNWNSGYGGFGGSARCPISRQGNYTICSSDYQMYNLDKGFGNGLNQDTCDHTLTSEVSGSNGCRTDILLFELK